LTHEAASMIQNNKWVMESTTLYFNFPLH
jgi:hypothetical protein